MATNESPEDKEQTITLPLLTLHRLQCVWDRGPRQCLSRPALLFWLLKLSMVKLCPVKGHKTQLDIKGCEELLLKDNDL